jgi:hypothetical protein
MGDENDQAVIEPAASRESIQLTDAGCALLRKKISTITNHIQADVQAKVGACSNLWEARRLLQSAGDLHNLLVNTLRGTFTCFDYKGTKVNTGGTGTPLPGNLLTCRVYSNHRAYRRRNSSYTWTIKLDYPASLPFSAEHVFYSFGEHEPPNASQRIRAYTAKFRNTAPATEVYWLIVKPGQKKEFEEFIQREGLDKVVKATTELPEKELDEDKPKVRARRSASVPAAQLLTLDRQTCESKTAAWQAGTGTLPAKACYVEVLNYDWRLSHNTSFTHPRELAATLALLDKCKDVPPVYGVRRQLLPKIEVQQPKWMPLKEYLDDFVTKNADKLWQGYLPATCDLSRVTGGRQITLFVAIADKVSKSRQKRRRCSLPLKHTRRWLH